MIPVRFPRPRLGAHFTDTERQLLVSMVTELREFGPRQTVTKEHVRIDHSLMLLDGLMCRHIDGRDDVRQIVALQVPGDFVDLHAFPLKQLDHDVATLTAARVAVLPHAQLQQVLDAHPELARKLWFLTLLDAAMHRQWVFRLGRLSAIGRIAHFLCEMNLRLLAIDASDGHRFALELTQHDLGECCGLTSIHVNRVMRELRDQGVCTFRQSRVDIHRLDTLMRLGQFDPRYLYLDDEVCARMAAAALPPARG